MASSATQKAESAGKALALFLWIIYFKSRLNLWIQTLRKTIDRHLKYLEAEAIHNFARSRRDI